MAQPQGPPYAPRVAGMGGIATPIPDVPITAVLLAFYVGAAIGHMTILQLNLRKGHKFILSGMLFGFCMTRILTLSLHMGTAYHPRNVSLYITTMIFLNAGIVMVYLVNIFFVQRIIRARQPQIGWHPLFRLYFRTLYALIAVDIILLIISIVLSFYTLDQHLRTICRDIQLAAVTFLLVVACLPLVLLAITWLLPKSKNATTFGAGSIATKSVILAVSASLCVLNAGFKTGTIWPAPRPIDHPAWYESRACLYVFYFVVEIIILYFFLAVRVDRRFHVPDGSSKRASFDPALMTSTQSSFGGSEQESDDVEKESQA